MKNKIMMFLMVLVFCLVGQKVSFSQNQNKENQKRAILCSLIFEDLSPEERKELLGIRREDKEEFRKIMSDLMLKKKEKLEILKEEDPELFRETIQRAQENIKKQLGQMKEKFNEVRDNKQKMGKAGRDKVMAQGFIFQTLTKDKQAEILELREKYRKTLAYAIKQRVEQLKDLKANNPEKFNEIIAAAKERTKELIRKGKEKYPKKFEELGKMKPEYIEDRLKWLKEDEPELFDDVTGRSSMRYRGGERPDSLEDEFDVDEVGNYYNEQE